MPFYGLVTFYRICNADLEEAREYRIPRGKLKVLELPDDARPKDIVELFFRMMKIVNIPLGNGSVIGFAVISFQDYSAVCIGTTGEDGSGIGHIRLCEYNKVRSKDPITRILHDVFQNLKTCGDPIPLDMFTLPSRGSFSAEKYIRFLSEACKKHINQGLSEEEIDELVDWFDKWWSEFERRYNEESSRWEGIFGVLDWFEKFDEFA